MGTLRSSAKCLTRALRGGNEASLKDLSSHFSVLALSNSSEFSRPIAGRSVPNFSSFDSRCSGGRSVLVFDRRKDVEIKEHAEEKHLRTLSYPRATLETHWLPSSLGFKIQSASVEWATRRVCRQHMSTAAVEASEPAPTDGIVITDSCIRRIKEIQTEDGAASPKMLRLSVEGGGCSGFLYNFSLDDKQNEDDSLFQKNGVTVVVDDISLSFVKGSTIDFSEELIRASFTVAANPNASSGCGCGASFTAK